MNEVFLSVCVWVCSFVNILMKPAWFATLCVRNWGEKNIIYFKWGWKRFLSCSVVGVKNKHLYCNIPSHSGSLINSLLEWAQMCCNSLLWTLARLKSIGDFPFSFFPTPAIGHITPICLYPLLFKDKPGVSAEEARGAWAGWAAAKALGGLPYTEAESGRTEGRRLWENLWAWCRQRRRRLQGLAQTFWFDHGKEGKP